jgi:hypothetical protein
MMRGAYEDRVRPKPVYVQTSPPLQPVIAPMTPAVPAKADAETAARRAQALHEKHVLAIYELMPGKTGDISFPTSRYLCHAQARADKLRAAEIMSLSRLSLRLSEPECIARWTACTQRHQGPHRILGT